MCVYLHTKFEFSNVILDRGLGLIALLLTAFNNQKATQEITTKSWNYSNKSTIKRIQSRINYYTAICVTPFNLALSSDIELTQEDLVQMLAITH